MPPVPARSSATSPLAAGAAATSAGASAAGATRFRLSVLLGAALFAPAAFLVLRGNLSVTDALLRFGCALVVAAAGTALVLATVPREAVAETAEPATASPAAPAAATPSAP
ncbi:hypothetical protein [Pedococcus ginsenosidimutans]|uniref:hypothetical protein n=1 Tax=Pedococcus ginsenosidimutans TaxID=490570 RepID=UPI0031EA549E